MNLPLLKDAFSTMIPQRNAITLPRQLAQGGTSMHFEREVLHSLLSSSTAAGGFALQKPVSPLLISACQNQKLSVSPGLLPGKSDLLNQQNMLIDRLSRAYEQAAPVPMVNQRNQMLNPQQLCLVPENLSIRDLNSLVSQLTNSVSELENKLQEVTQEKEILEKKLKRYEQLELAAQPRPPVQLIFVPKKKRLRRPATQVPRSHKCPVVQCQKTYGSDTSLNLHIRKKHPSFKLSNESTPSE